MKHVYTRELCKLLADKRGTGECCVRATVEFLGISAFFGFLHPAVKQWVEQDGVDWQALVAAATGKEPMEPEGVPSDGARVFGEILMRLRASARVESAELAARAEIQTHRFQQIYSGLSEPNVVEMFSIARALDIEPSELITNFEDASNTSAF